jgi:AraC-like DNA-binding protein
VPISTLIIDSPRLVSAIHISNQDPLWNTPLRQHENTEFFFVQKGRGEFQVNKQVLMVNEGDLIVYNPFVEHAEKSSVDRPIKGIRITLTNLQINGNLKGCIIQPNAHPIYHIHSNQMIIDKLLTEILGEYNNPQIGSDEIISSLLQTVVVIIVRLINQTEPVNNLSISQNVRGYIERNFHEELSLSFLASLVFVSPYHLSHLFKDEIGMSPIQYLIHCRIEESKRLLEHSDQSIREISANVGYPNANYFNLLFKKVTGHSPGKYRKNQIN